MMTRLRRCGALGLASALACGALACGAADRVHEGEHVTLIIDPAVETCGDMLGHMDRFVATLADYLRVPLAGERFTFVWYSEERFAAEAPCGDNWWGECERGGEILSTVAPLDSMLAYMLLARVGSPPPFFAEGALVAFTPDLDSFLGGLPGDGDVQDLLAYGKGGATLAGAFTRFLIDRHGRDAYLAFYAGVRARASLPEIEAAHAEHFGESLTETSVAFDAGRRRCPERKFELKLLECSAPRIAWDGDSLLLRRSLACGEDDVVGYPSSSPFNDYALSLSTLEVTTAGPFEIRFTADEPASLVFAGCGGCEDETAILLSAGREPVRQWLPVGRYYLKLVGNVKAAPSVALRIERVDVP
ncbi:MAG: hypothetical protein H0T76_20015 [Nannocystis sp.]|nr:hypothetical protein [Nannocystis sp.]MBA3548774.1 hypothetical protein [Nannocystis sp.]